MRMLNMYVLVHYIVAHEPEVQFSDEHDYPIPFKDSSFLNEKRNIFSGGAGSSQTDGP